MRYVPTPSPIDVNPALRSYVENEFRSLSRTLDGLDTEGAELPASLRDFGAVGDGVTDDSPAIQLWLDSGKKRLYAPAGDYLIDTNAAFVVPSGFTIEGDGALTRFLKTGVGMNTDVFTTTGDNVTFRSFRMEGPDNTSVDGIVTDGGSWIVIEFVEGYQLSSTVTIGLTTNTDQVLVRGTYSEDNAQQGVHFNKATNFEACGNRATLIGTTNLHHGMYIGDCSIGKAHDNFCWANAGSGIHGNPQGFASQNIRCYANHCWDNGTSGSGERAGILWNRDATATANDIGIDDNQCWDNEGANILVSGVDLCTLEGNVVADGTNGLQVTAPHTGTTMRVLIRDGRTRAHGSNIRLSAVAGATLNVDINGTDVIDADGPGDVGIFADGAGTVDVGVGDDTLFFNNTTDTLHTASGGALVVRT